MQVKLIYSEKATKFKKKITRFEFDRLEFSANFELFESKIITERSNSCLVKSNMGNYWSEYMNMIFISFQTNFFDIVSLNSYCIVGTEWMVIPWTP